MPLLKTDSWLSNIKNKNAFSNTAIYNKWPEERKSKLWSQQAPLKKVKEENGIGVASDP